VAFGWRAPFIVFALIGVVWAVVWFWYYRDSPSEHRFVNEAEKALITSKLGVRNGAGRQAVPWKQILTAPQMWILAAMYACYAYSIGIYLSWFPKYLVDTHGFGLAKMGLFASLPLMAGVLGDLAGGYVSDKLYERTGNLKMARRLVAIVGFLVAGSMILVAISQTDPVIGVAFFCLAVFGLELTVGVSWAVALDIGDEFAGSVSAVMNTAGNLGGTVAAAATGYLVTYYGWNSAFGVLAALAGIAAFLFLWIDASKRVYATPAATA